MPSQTAEFSRRSLELLRQGLASSFSVKWRHIPRVFFHGVILATIMAGFWLLDSLKDPVLAQTVGIEHQPQAKVLSVAVTLITTCLYDFLTSWLSKPNLFHVLLTTAGIVMMVLSALLSDPVNGLSNTSDIGVHRTIGWCAYFSIEVYGSLMVALFWSFTNSVMDLEQAKGAYGLIISITQVGAIIGATTATQASTIGIPLLFLMSSVTIFSVSLLVKLYFIVYKDRPTMQDPAPRRLGPGAAAASGLASRTISSDAGGGVELATTSYASLSSRPSTPAPLDNEKAGAALRAQGMVQVQLDEAGEAQKPPSPRNLKGQGRGFLGLFSGFYEGLSLILKHRYVLLLLGVSCLYEVVITVLDYQFKILGAEKSAHEVLGGVGGITGAGDRFANLLGHFGQLTNLLSFFISFFGFSFLVRLFGVRASLMVFPSVLFVAVLLTNFSPSLWVLFICVSVVKAIVFSLHDPVKELLYIPTSQSIKFKAKAWIDVFGSRLAKACGSFITSYAQGNAARLRAVAEIPCLTLAIAILALAWGIGTEFQRLVDQRIVIGADDEDALSGGMSRDASRPLASSSREEWGSRSGDNDDDDEGRGLVVDGKRPGDVGYAGYDNLQSFVGEEWNESLEGKRGAIKGGKREVTFL